MKINITFNMPEDNKEFYLALKSARYYSILCYIQTHCEYIIKSGSGYTNPEELAKHILNFIKEEVDLEHID